MAAACALMALPAHAGAGFRARIAVVTLPGKPQATVTVNDQPAVTLRAMISGHGPEGRAALVAKRLTALVGAGLLPGEVVPRHVSSRVWGVAARGTVLLQALPDEARAHGQTSEALARAWTGSLRRLLALPPLSLSLPGLVVPLNETRTVTVGGAASAASLAASDENANVSHSQFDPQRRTLTVRGLAAGRTSVQITTDGAAIALPVSVMPYAAQISPAVTVTITGRPDAPAEWVAQAVYAGLAQAVNAQDGAFVRLISPPQITSALAQGAQTTVRVPVQIGGPGLLPVSAAPIVTISNEALPARAVAVLFYSNSPEQVKSAQPLFFGRLQPFQPARLVYHHQNESAGALVFHADVINGSDAPAAVQVVSGISLPGTDTVQVGRRAGAAFLRAMNSEQGIVLLVPPHARVPVVTQRFASGLTVSGLVQLQQTDGRANALSVQVAADSDGQALQSPIGRVILTALGDAGRGTSPLPDQPTDYGHGAALPAPSPTVFPAPSVALSGSYAVGGQWGYVRFGDRDSLHDASGKLTLWGNYGADYEIVFTLSNPTTAAKPVGLYFAPQAGAAAGVFRVDDGLLVELDPTSPPQEPLLARLTLAPGETRRVRVQTIPLNGSFYPAALIVHSL